MLAQVRYGKAGWCRLLWLVGAGLVLSGLAGAAQAQESYRLAGRVVDASTGDPLPGVHIFLASRQEGTTTDRNGQYAIESIEAGTYQVVISMVGYTAAVAQVQLAGSQLHYQLDARLEPAVYTLEDVEVVDEVPREWQRQLGRFTEFFLGRSENARMTDIENPEVLEFREDDRGFYASASAPLLIENRGLGYQMTFVLTDFRIDKQSGLRFTDGFWRLQPLTPRSRSEEHDWSRRRDRAFKGSLQHLLWSMVHGVEAEEGFRIVLDERDYAPFLTEMYRLDEQVRSDSVLTQAANGHFELRFQGFLRVDYTLFDEDRGLFRRLRPPERQRSFIKLNVPSVSVHPRGYIYAIGQGSGLVTAYGHMASQGAADLLPQEYADQRAGR